MNRTITSLGIILTTLGLTYIPIPGISQTIFVVSGSELEEPLQKLEQQFEQEYPNIKVELKTQGSQDIVNNYIDQKNDFTPTVLIPANGEKLEELRDRLSNQGETNPFYQDPQPIAKTLLVGIAWSERGQILFPTGRFEWNQLQKAMDAGNWGKIGGDDKWGSFDFVTTDPTRSNSGQLTLGLWVQSQGGGTLNLNSFNTPDSQSLFSLVKKSVYLPPRSTDILLQEFITRGPNDADVATVYESIALYRWEQAGQSQGKPYQIYYLDPTIETVATAAIVRQEVGKGTAKAAQQFVEFLTQPEQQKLFVTYGFRPVIGGIDLNAVPNSPWAKNIPGAEVNPPVQSIQPPNSQVIGEIQRSWERAN